MYIMYIKKAAAWGSVMCLSTYKPPQALLTQHYQVQIGQGIVIEQGQV
jgi:hypothetical protein